MPFWVILGHFWAICSRNSRETLKYGTFGRKKIWIPRNEPKNIETLRGELT